MLAVSDGSAILISLGLLIWVLAGVIIGGWLGELRGRAGLGAFVGLLLGPLGLIVAALLPRTKEVRAREQLEFEAELRRQRVRRAALEGGDKHANEAARERLELERRVAALRDEDDREYGAALRAEAKHQARLAKMIERVNVGN